MATVQPASGDKLNSPDHSLLHRQIASDTSAPVKSIDIDSDGAIQGGTPLFQNINPTNLLSNGDFEAWSAGTSSAPDGWTMSGASATVARSTTKKIGTYSTAVTRAGTDCELYKAVHATKGIDYWKGRTATLGCWVYATVASRARIYFSGPTGNVYSSYHTGGSTWEWLSITGTIALGATSLTVSFEIKTGDTTAYFDGAMLVEGSSAFSFSPKPVVEGFGSWVDNTSSYGATLAATDGFVVAKATNTELQGYTDSASNPTTLRVHTDAGGDVCMTFPVRKGDYWKVVVVGGTTNIGVFWLPLGR